MPIIEFKWQLSHNYMAYYIRKFISQPNVKMTMPEWTRKHPLHILSLPQQQAGNMS